MAKESRGRPRGRSASPSSATRPTSSKRLSRSGFRPDIVTEMCPCHDPISYIPSGYSPAQADALREQNRARYLELARKTMMRQLRAMNSYFQMGVPTFEYGTSIRKECRDAGMPVDEAMTIPGFVAEYIRPLFCEGRGPFRWTCVSGEASDLAKLDDLCLEMFKDDLLVTRWITLAREHIPIEALPGQDLLPRLRTAEALRPGGQRADQDRRGQRPGGFLTRQPRFRLDRQSDLRIGEHA